MNYPIAGSIPARCIVTSSFPEVSLWNCVANVTSSVTFGQRQNSLRAPDRLTVVWIISTLTGRSPRYHPNETDPGNSAGRSHLISNDTPWTLILSAQKNEQRELSQQALSDFAMRIGRLSTLSCDVAVYSSLDAQDFVQGFFTCVPAEGILSRADQEKERKHPHLPSDVVTILRCGSACSRSL